MQAVDVVRAARFLTDHLAEPIGLGDVADHVGYSPFHLARCFERHIGMPPGRFLAGHRFQLAKRMLLDGDDRVLDVCHAAGFTGAGTFTSRFTAMVGSSPTDFRRLPDLLASAPPRPVVVPGRARGGSVVTGRVTLTSSAAATVGPVPFVYVGLFTKHAARGLPVSGAMLAGPGEFLLEDVPAGTFWVLASALPASADFDAQLVPDRTVAGAAVEAVYVPAPAAGGLPPRAAPARHHRDLVLDVLPAWSSPVLVALPRLASPAAQDWQDRR